MDKTININIAGTLFHIDEDAYNILRDYLQALNNRFRNVQGGHETVSDIEARIAEIFRSQKGTAGAVSVSLVQSMIAIIGKPEEFDSVEAEPDPATYTSARKRMYRNPDDTIIGGVCGGIGAYLNTDPVLFRVLFVIFTISFGIGIFIYAVLWLALPCANTDSRKMEMYGSSYSAVMAFRKSGGQAAVGQLPSYNKGYYNTSRLGSAINELFRAVGRILFIALRILLIVLGICFVLTGALVMFSFIMLLVFKYPVSISNSGFDMNLIYLTDFLKYIFNPVLVPWITGISLLIIIIPMIALIYWGVKMIFWFKAKDAIFSLAAFVLWMLLIAALSVILFNEGISFAETAKTSAQNIFSHKPAILYIKTGKRLADVSTGKEISFSDEGYNIVINDPANELYIRPYLNVYNSGQNEPRVELRKRSQGRNESDAMKKAEALEYTYTISGDTLILDEYFTIPAGRRWAADNIGINLYLPEKCVIKLDKPSLSLLHSFISREYYEAEEEADSADFSDTWVLTEDGLEPASGQKFIHK